jgi:hypothetical protein
VAFACAMVVLFAIDFEHQILPNEITLSGIVVGFVLSIFLPPGWKSSLIGLLAGGLFPFLVAEILPSRARARGDGHGRLQDAGDGRRFPWVAACLDHLDCRVRTRHRDWRWCADDLAPRHGDREFRSAPSLPVAALVCAYADESMVRAYQQVVHAYLTWAGLA